VKTPNPHLPLEQQDEDTLLAMLVWGEARGEPAAGRVAVAHVPLTRLQSRMMTRKTPSFSLREIILRNVNGRIYQFSCLNPNDPNRVKLFQPIENGGLGLWSACWTAAVEAIQGQSVNPAPGATHYVVRRLWSRPTAAGRRPQWFEAPMIQNGTTTFIAEIGSHIFARTR
jgi:spore germination cell wall hydrolase CwlJ-like protein